MVPDAQLQCPWPFSDKTSLQRSRRDKALKMSESGEAPGRSDDSEFRLRYSERGLLSLNKYMCTLTHFKYHS